MAYPHSILVIDDDRALRSTVQFLLELEGYQVDAVNAPVAMALMACRKPDLVLLDVDMPLLNGKEVRDCLLADVETADIPVIAMAEKGTLKRQQQALQAQGGLAKPLEYDALVTEVARRLQAI